VYHFTDGGLRNVWLTNGYTEHQTVYGSGVSFHDLDGLVKTICAALCKKPGKLTGAEFRYIRTALLLSQKSIGKLFGYTEQAVAKWEKLGKVPKVVDAALRLVCIAQFDGNKKVSTAVNMLNVIDRISNARIIVNVTHSKWTAKIEVVDDGAIDADMAEPLETAA